MENASMVDKRELVSVRSLSEMIDTPPKTIRDWVYKGYLNIPYIKLGQQLRFDTKEIRKWWGTMRIVRKPGKSKPGRSQ